MLSERAQILLKIRALHRRRSAGGFARCRVTRPDLSPASIRKYGGPGRDGLVASPHTSAGRVPTPRGYRFFVDSLLTLKALDRAEIDQLVGQLHGDQPQRLVQSASHLLSDLTRFAGVVMAPRRRSTSFRHLEFLRLSDRRILLIIVTESGEVQNRILFTERAYSRRS